MTIGELRELLAESRELLREAARVEQSVATAGAGWEASLTKCRDAAEAGYQQAIGHVDAMGEAVKRIQAEADRLTRSGKTDDSQAALKGQLEQIVQQMQESHSRLSQEIESKRKHLSTFNITLFGRTMSGKSTLMEILTHGDGSAIGKGAQRTTRDVRTYPWQGLTVTDVPGVAAFEGAEDAETAHDAANQADLALFLITDDAPQAAEAEHLARLRRQGKPVLGICNVKMNINSGNELSVRRFIRDHDKQFAPARLRELSRQFDELAGHQVRGHRLELVCVHLLARFLAGRPENAGQPWRGQLEQASRFQDVEHAILWEVTTNGPFRRADAFLQIAAAANLETWEAARQAAELCEQAQVRRNARLDELRAWRTGFERSSRQRIDRLVQQTVGSLRNRMPDFANRNYEDQRLSDRWNALVRNSGIDQKCQALQEQLAQECQEYIQQLVADLQREMRLLELQIEAVSLDTGPIGNPRRRWNWGVNLASGGVVAGLGALTLANIWNPVGWTLAGVGVVVGGVSLIANLFGRLFGNRDQKRREAIAKITEALRENLDDIEGQIRGGMGRWLDEFTRQYAAQAEGRFRQVTQAQGRLAGILRGLANQQRESLLAVNRSVIAEALQHLGERDAARSIVKIARIPGQAVVNVTGDNSQLSPLTVYELKTLLGEDVIQIPDLGDGPQIKPALEHLGQSACDRLVAQIT